MKKNTFFLVIILLLNTLNSNAQIWEQTINPDEGLFPTIVKDISVDGAGDLIVGGFSYDIAGSLYGSFLSKITPDGTVLWERIYPSLYFDPTGDEHYYIGAETTTENEIYHFRMSDGSLIISKLDENGDSLSTQTYDDLGGNMPFFIRDVTEAVDGGYLLVGGTGVSPNASAMIAKLDEAVNLQWTELFNGIDGWRAKIVSISAESFVVSDPGIVQKRDTAGNELWSIELASPLQDHDIIETSEGDFVYLSRNYVAKISGDGILLWEKNLPVEFNNKVVRELSDGSYILGGRYGTNAAHFIGLTNLTSGGELIWDRIFGEPSFDVFEIPEINGFDIVQDSDSTLIIGNSCCLDIPSNTDAYVFKIPANGYVFDNLIQGRVFKDDNLDCISDPGELGLTSRIVEVVGDDNIAYAITDENGTFDISLDTGTYAIRSILPNNYWGTCIDVPYIFTISGPEDTISLDLPAQLLFECPFLEVDIGASFLRRCFENTYYVNYCNYGTIAADSAVVQVVLDPNMLYLTSSIDLAAQNGDTLLFELGSLGVDSCGQFSIAVFLDEDCDQTVLGQSHCVTALISPDSTCIPIDPDWDGSSLITRAECINDSLFFFIRNIGLGDMLIPSSYIVTEDVIMHNSEGDEVLLTSGEEVQVLAIASNESTWRLEVDQVEGHPGESNPSTVVEGCNAIFNPGSPFNLGLVNAFPMDDYNPFISIDCQQNIGSYDPNDKLASPTGWTEENFIEQNEPIEYMIRFQNNGTDTAFNVVIEDVIAPQLDITTIRPGASSHPYEVEIRNPRRLIFNFENILLPDSVTNEAASHGFVKFKIDQNKDLAPGTIIRNSADIYFDFNTAIRTNEAFHTIVSPLPITLDIEEPILPNVYIEAFPNPFQEWTQIQVKGQSFDNMELKLFDVGGKLIRTLATNEQTFILHRNHLNAGIYFFRIETNKQLIGVGKLLVQ